MNRGVQLVMGVPRNHRPFLEFSWNEPTILGFSYGFPTVFLWFSYGFPLVWGTPVLNVDGTSPASLSSSNGTALRAERSRRLREPSARMTRGAVGHRASTLEKWCPYWQLSWGYSQVRRMLMLWTTNYVNIHVYIYIYIYIYIHLTHHTLHFTLYTLYSTLYTLHLALHAPHFTLCTLHFTLSTPHSTLYTPNSTLYTPHFTLCTLHFTLYTLHFPIHTLHSALYIPYSTLYTPQFTLYTPHFALYTLHSIYSITNIYNNIYLPQVGFVDAYWCVM